MNGLMASSHPLFQQPRYLVGSLSARTRHNISSKNGVSIFGCQRRFVRLLASMSTTSLQHPQKTTSEGIAIPIMVNGCSGRMGNAVIKAADSAGLHVLPMSFGSEKESGQTMEVCGKEILVYGPAERERVLSSLFDEYPHLIVVDYTVPDAVNDNAELYCKVGVPFVMGTTGGDRDRLYKTVEDSKVYAVISPQMGKQVVAFLAAMEIMSEQFPGAFSGYSLKVMESHQASKLDFSGTAKAVISCFQKLGVSFDMDQIQMIRDPKQQAEMVGVPEEHLSGHAFHLYHLTSPDETVSFEFQHNVCGRSIYAEGTVDAIIFLAKKIMSWEESTRWFGEVVPALANLLYRLPSLLEMHYQNADHLLGGGKHGINTGLRLLGPQEAGIVFLSQELIGALLACSFFCLFPVANRGAKHLPTINFDHLFATLYESCSGKQENKIKCIIHYFERISSCMPIGLVSFERKILPVELHSSCVVYPEADFWSRSVTPLSRFEVHDSGNIEDQLGEALEVDFANRYLGGGALHGGCVQEEIRFMINPELIAGMLCFPSMDDNEAIEIVGAERFSSYTGYASSFRFSGDYRDKRDVDYFGRRKTRIIAIDALCGPRMRQFEVRCLIREMNKAYCGFLHQSKCCRCERILGDNGCFESRLEQNNISYSQSAKDILLHEAPLSSADTGEGKSVNQESRNPNEKGCPCLDHEDNIGIVTGNWGCGAFGGDPELKAMIQWLAASQAVRPFISYYTFGMEALQDLDQVTKWVLHHEWTVGDLWNMLAEYSLQRLKGETNLGFFSWLLPWLAAGEGQMSNSLKLP